MDGLLRGATGHRFLAVVLVLLLILLLILLLLLLILILVIHGCSSNIS